MKHELNTDTIAAIATARGPGGIGVIRISGGLSLSVLQGMFRKNPEREAGATEFRPRLLTYGWIMNNRGRALDEVLAVYMPGPHTFSGEDVVEIHCHGGQAVLDAVLESVLERGARLAQAGEFTRRAWLNGRLDLSRAEAVAEMIAAPTRQGVYLASNKLQGRLGAELDEVRQKMDWLRARLCLALDFPDDAEEQDSGIYEDFLLTLAELDALLGRLVEAHDRARLWREGALVVLAGEVNVGKSSLMNALLGRRRAIVSDTPGTTRDFIEESINLDGLPVRLVDTAGLRQSGDSIENEGMELARELFDAADLVLLMLDRPDAATGGENARLVREYGNKILVGVNKNDLRPSENAPEKICGCAAVSFSAKTGNGLDGLTKEIYRKVTEQAVGLDFEQAAPPTLRQRHLLASAREEAQALATEYRAGVLPDLLSVRLDSIAAMLEDVIGMAGNEDILDAVFSSFCIGK